MGIYRSAMKLTTFCLLLLLISVQSKMHTIASVIAIVSGSLQFKAEIKASLCTGDEAKCSATCQNGSRSEAEES